MKELLPVGCVIMASGVSRRFGSNKLLADFCGEPMLCRAFAAAGADAVLNCHTHCPEGIRHLRMGSQDPAGTAKRNRTGNLPSGIPGP